MGSNESFESVEHFIDKIIELIKNNSGGSGKVANNLTTTEKGWVLDARMGKELADMINDPMTDDDVTEIVGYLN